MFVLKSSARIRIITFVFIAGLLCATHVFPQIINKNNSKVNLEAVFIKEHDTITPSSTFFNILKVTNKSTQPVTFNAKFTVPEGWGLINENNKLYTLAPQQTEYIPFRTAVASVVKGGIAYVVVGALISDKNEILKSGYCYAKTPVKKDLRLRPISRVEYFDPITKKAKLVFRLENKGNINELVNLDFTCKHNLTMAGAENDKLNVSISMEANTDTVLEFDVFKKYRSEVDEKANLMQMINVKAGTQDTAFHFTAWFKTVESKYTRNIEESWKPLVVELLFQNLLNSDYPRVIAYVKGNVLLKKKRDIYYYYRNLGNRTADDFLKYSRVYVGYMDKNFHVRLGDIIPALEQPFQGKGIDASYTFFEKHTIQAAASINEYNPITNFGGSYKYMLNRFTDFRGGFAFTRDKYRNIESSLGFLDSRFNLFKKHSFRTVLGYSDAFRYAFTTPFHKNGLGYLFNYKGTFNKLHIDIRNRFGSREYTTQFKGRFEVTAQALYDINKKSDIALIHSNYRYNPSMYFNDVLLPERYYNTDQTTLRYGINLKPTIYLFGGPVVENKTSNDFYSYQDNTNYFSTTTGLFHAGVRIRSRNQYSILTPSIYYGLTNVNHFSYVLNGKYDSSVTDIPMFGNAIFKLNYTHRYWGVHLLYYYGPSNLIQQYAYFYNGHYAKSFYFMPYYERFIYRDIIRLRSNLSYINDITSDRERLSINTQVWWYLPKDWTLYLLNTFYLNSRKDYVNIGGNEDMLLNVTQKSTYLEFGVRKDFGFQQPRLKFYDLHVVFYIDDNGNRQKDENEPGVKNVLANIDRAMDSVFVNENYNGEYIPVELLSDQYGMVTYENIPEGNYTLKYLPMDRVQGYTNGGKDAEPFVINQNTTLFIPFFETYKITGRVVINRAEFSNLGRIDAANIKISAQDTLGNQYSTLTDAGGGFVLSLPSSGRYDVKITNIFYEYFDVNQEEYEIAFNGYKKFELTFIFNERPRKIRFDSKIDTETPFKEDVIIKTPTRDTSSTGMTDGTTPTDITTTTITPTTTTTTSENTPVNTKMVKKFYIIAGSSKTEEGAKDILKRVQALGFAGEILPKTPDGNTRVAFNSFTTKEEAQAELSRIRKNITQGAWMLEQVAEVKEGSKEEKELTTVTEKTVSVKRYYIIENSYSTEQAANNAAKKLNNQGFDKAKVAGKAPSGGYMVCYDYFEDKAAAENVLGFIRQDVSPTAWLLEQLDVVKSSEYKPEVKQPVNPNYNNTNNNNNKEEIDRIIKDAEDTKEEIKTDEIINEINNFEKEAEENKPIEQPAGDDPSLIPVSEITEDGLVFKVQLYTKESGRMKQEELDGLPDIICMKGSGGGYLYFTGSFSKYDDANDIKEGMVALGFGESSVAAFRNKRKITLEEAGVK